MLNVSILTPEKTLFKGQAELVEVPGKNGKFQMLNNHAPIVSSLEKGNVIIKLQNETKEFPIISGAIECNKNEIIILIEK